MISLCQCILTQKNIFSIIYIEVIIVVMKPDTKTITLRVSKDLYEIILNEANIEERSVNNFISYAVKTYIENKETCKKIR